MTRLLKKNFRAYVWKGKKAMMHLLPLIVVYLKSGDDRGSDYADIRRNNFHCPHGIQTAAFHSPILMNAIEALE